MATMRTAGRSRRAFTLIELITVIGVVIVLIALLLPSLINARKHAQTVQCASNVRQLTMALLNYSVEFRGRFPPNSAQIDQYWFNDDILGRYLKSAVPMVDRTIAGGVLVCPGDLDETIRSYSMNIYASSYVSSHVAADLESDTPRGKLFRAGASPSSNLMLVIESFSAWEAPGHEPAQPTTPFAGYVANAIIGYWGDRPADRFGAGAAVHFAGGRFGSEVISQVCYFRHRNKKTSRLITDAWGRANIGFLDGHVATFAHDELADFKTAKSTFVAMWSPIDRAID